MTKHRGTVYAVVREHYDGDEAWIFSGIVGVYVTLQRAEEIADSSMQVLRENGFTENHVRFAVRPVTYYDE